MEKLAEELDQIGQEVERITGLENSRINDILRYHESDKNGVIIIEMSSQKQLEEDLSQMAKQETLFSPEKYKELFAKCAKEICELYGKYIPKESLQHNFPGIDLDNLEKYDFNNSKIYLVVVSNEDYKNIHDAMNYKNTGSAFTRSPERLYPSTFATQHKQILLNEKTVIIAKDIPGGAAKIINKNITKKEDLTEQEIIFLEDFLHEVLVHEMLHVLGAAKIEDRELKENVTEWLTQNLIYSTQKGNAQLHDISTTPGYEYGTYATNIMLTAVMEEGGTEETIYKAFISNESVALDTIGKLLYQRYGRENANTIIQNKFKDSRDFFKFMVLLEREKDSEIGKFLKEFGPYKNIPLK